MTRQKAWAMEDGSVRDKYHLIIYLINAISNRIGAETSTVYRRMKSSNIIDEYLLANYDVLHTQGTDYLVDDIIDLMKQRGVA